MLDTTQLKSAIRAAIESEDHAGAITLCTQYRSALARQQSVTPAELAAGCELMQWALQVVVSARAQYAREFHNLNGGYQPEPLHIERPTVLRAEA